jgi:anti-sigma regulatory factor (Ser/Thr protein kinase)
VDPTPSSDRISLRLAVTADSVPVARRAVDRLAWPADQDESEFNTRLLITELVTNSVRHAGLTHTDTVTLVMQPLPGGIRVEVADHGPGFSPRQLTEPPSGTSGRGIFLVDALADRWGVEPAVDRSLVWFEIDYD